MTNELILQDKKKNNLRKKGEGVYGFITASIPLLGFILFGFIPLVFSIAIAFCTPNGYQIDGMVYVGLENFKTVLTDPLFWLSVKNTLLNCLVTPLSMCMGLLVASLLNNTRLKGRTIFKSIFFLPFVISVVASSIMWKYLLDANYGLFNQILASFHLPSIDFLGDPNWVMPTMIFLGVWSGMGYSIILYSAALTSVDPALYEAADIDGASTSKKFFSVTIPSIMPITFFLLTTGLIGNLQDFARFQVLLPGGGPNSSGLTIVYYLYEKGWTEIITYGMGVANAASWILTMMVMLFTIGQFSFNKKQGDMTA